MKPDWLIQQVPANWGIQKVSKKDELEGMPASVAELLPSIEESLPQTKMTWALGDDSAGERARCTPEDQRLNPRHPQKS